MAGTLWYLTYRYQVIRAMSYNSMVVALFSTEYGQAPCELIETLFAVISNTLTSSAISPTI